MIISLFARKIMNVYFEMNQQFMAELQMCYSIQ